MLSLCLTFLDLLLSLPCGRQDLSNEPNGYACQGQLLSGLDRRIQTCQSIPRSARRCHMPANATRIVSYFSSLSFASTRSTERMGQPMSCSELSIPTNADWSANRPVMTVTAC